MNKGGWVHSAAGATLLPTVTSRRDVNDECDHYADDRPERPLPVEPVLYGGIPEERRGKEDDAQDQPQEGVDDPDKPIREQEEDHHDQAWRQECEQGEQKRHCGLL